jgi:putative cardiolipin synthase
MNFDQRSMHLNTEIGLLIDSPILAQQLAVRFESMTKPENAYEVFVRAPIERVSPGLAWLTQEEGTSIEYEREPARSAWQRIGAELLTQLPLDREL